MTTSNESRAIVYSEFVTNWPSALSPTVPHTFDNEAFDSDGLSEWVRLIVRQTGGGQYTLGAAGTRVFRRRAAVLVELYVAVDSGLQRMDELARAAREIFEAKTISQVAFYDGDYRELSPLDGWMRGLVTVSFDYDEQK
jgi:hypothetical protein